VKFECPVCKTGALLRCITAMMATCRAGNLRSSCGRWWRRSVRALESVTGPTAVRCWPALQRSSRGHRQRSATTVCRTWWSTSCPRWTSSSATFSPRRSVVTALLLVVPPRSQFPPLRLLSKSPPRGGAGGHVYPTLAIDGVSEVAAGLVIL